jgi:hypothetical protein
VKPEGVMSLWTNLKWRREREGGWMRNDFDTNLEKKKKKSIQKTKK